MGGIKPCGTEELYGCSPTELVKHIESQWSPGMSWDNHGPEMTNWNIDHIKALSEFDLTKKMKLEKPAIIRICVLYGKKDNLIKSVEDRKNSIHKDSWVE